jgi:hypothetical protein
MVVFVSVVLIALVVASITYPLFRKEEKVVTKQPITERLRQLNSELEAIDPAIQQLEIDLKSGSITEADYIDRKVNYLRRAEAIRSRTDGLEKGTEPREEDDIERRVLELRRAKRSFCPSCRAPAREGDKFCPECGTRITPGRQT